MRVAARWADGWGDKDRRHGMGTQHHNSSLTDHRAFRYRATKTPGNFHTEKHPTWRIIIGW